MVAQPTIPTFTVAEYLAMEAVGDAKHEYVDGYIYAMSGGTLDHDRIGNNVRTVIDAHLGDSLCIVHGPDIRLRISPTVYYYPDAIVICDQTLTGTDLELHDARLVVEVLSDSTATNDRGDKFANYQTLPNFEEYLLVDGCRRAAERYHRAPNGTWIYQRYAPGDIVTLETLGLSRPLATFYRHTQL